MLSEYQVPTKQVNNGKAGDKTRGGGKASARAAIVGGKGKRAARNPGLAMKAGQRGMQSQQSNPKTKVVRIKSQSYEELEDSRVKRRRVGNSSNPKKGAVGRYEEVPLEGGGYRRRPVGGTRKQWQYICKHGHQRSTCKECGGSSMCEHGRLRYRCKECGGKGICEHGRQRHRCKECKAPSSQGRGPAEESTIPPPSVQSMATTVVI